jgi:hypothetical protein
MQALPPEPKLNEPANQESGYRARRQRPIGEVAKRKRHRYTRDAEHGKRF